MLRRDPPFAIWLYAQWAKVPTLLWVAVIVAELWVIAASERLT